MKNADCEFSAPCDTLVGIVVFIYADGDSGRGRRDLHNAVHGAASRSAVVPCAQNIYAVTKCAESRIVHINSFDF